MKFTPVGRLLSQGTVCPGALRSVRRRKALRFQVPCPGCNSPILASRRPENGLGLRHVPLARTGSGLVRRKPRARTLCSPGGVCHSRLPLSARPVTDSGGTFPTASGFARCRHSRVSGNAHKPLTF